MILNIEKKNIYFDMDGVLCEYKKDSKEDDYKKEGYFASLKPRVKTIECIKKLIEANIANVFVLSAVITECAEQSIKEKNEWLDKYLPEIDSAHRLFTLCGENKANKIGNLTKNHYLFDDYSNNLFLWASAGGYPVKVINEVNGKNGSFNLGPRIEIDDYSQLVSLIS